MRALLGVQSHFSFHWGTASPTAWFARAEALGYEYLGIADHASLCGLPEIVKAAEAGRVKPLHGASFPLAGGRAVLAYAGTAEGYGNLCRLVTDWRERLGAGPGPAAGGVPVLAAAAARPLFLEGGRVGGLAFIADDPPLWHTLRAAGAEVYWRVGPSLAAPPPGVPPDAALFAPGPFLIAPEEFETHRLLRAIGGAATLDRAPPLAGSPDGWLRTPEAYAGAFAVYADAIRRADALAARLARFAPSRATLHPPTPEAAAGDGGGEPPLARLRRLAYEGAAIRYGEVGEPAQRRLERELALIDRKGFAEYFLVVHDIVNRLAGGDGRVRRGRSVTCGRGSGAASLVNYCLGVTNVDALKHNLMFERFLNEARRDPPDIDVDFAWDERDDVLDKVFAGYGDRRVGRIANHNRYDWRGAFRAAARTLGYADAEITRHLRESPVVYGDPHPGWTPAPEAERAPEPSRSARKLDVLRRRPGSDWDRAAGLAGRIVGVPHGLSMHCGGVVIARGDLSRLVPTALSRKGQPTIQWEKDGAEDMGLVKIDLLGNRSLAVIRDAVGAVARAEGRPEGGIIPDDPSDDPATMALVARGDTFGVFYFESPAMRLLLAKAGRGDFAHAVIHSSIIRPAANAFISEYLERLHGKPWKPEHESLAGLFDESYGIPVYQEDVVKLAMALAGWDYARADGLRKCLGKRDAEERLTAAFPELAEAARANGVDEATIQGFWRTLMSMTGYSFCKPHSASYARVSYEAAYLRAHHPAHFIAAVLSNGGGFYSTQSYVSEAMRLGLAVLGPDANASAAAWRAEGTRAVRVGLAAVSGLPRAATGAIVGNREAGGRYRGLEDFLRRLRLPQDDLRRLALVGGLDSLAPGLNRPQILWRVGQASWENGDPLQRRPGPAAGAGSLFARSEPGRDRAANAFASPEPAPRGPAVPDLPPYSREQRLAAEYAALGFIPGQHPLALFADAIRAGAERRLRRAHPVPTSAGRIREHVGKLVTILAWPVTAKIVETKGGDAMMFQSFEDAGAICEAVVFPEAFRRFHPLLSVRQPLWVTGRVEEEFGVATLRVMRVDRILDAEAPILPPPEPSAPPLPRPGGAKELPACLPAPAWY